MSGRERNLRLFVAALPPRDTAERLLNLLPTLPIPCHRPTIAAQVHLTVHFIGPCPVRKLDDVTESARRATAGLNAFSLTPTRLITLPTRRPRLLAAELSSDSTLLELRRRLVSRLARHPRPDANDRFRPHMTLCRFERNASTPEVAQELDDQPSFAVDRVQLMHSSLRPTGAVHEIIETLSIGGS